MIFIFCAIIGIGFGCAVYITTVYAVDFILDVRDYIRENKTY